MDLLETLDKIGFKKQESTLYLTLLGLGSANIMTISRATKISRPQVYKTLDTLRQKGLVAKIRKGRREYYFAEPPEVLHRLVQAVENAVDKIIPELQLRYRSGEEKPVAKYFEGRDGIRFVWDDVVSSLKKGDTYYRYSSSLAANQRRDYLSSHYHDMRTKKQIERFVITNEAISKLHERDMDMEIRVIPKESDLFEYGITGIIYADKIAFIDYSKEMAFIVENKAIADFQRAIFKTLYKRLEPLKNLE